MRKRILITNDDGIHAPGIRHLWQALKKEWDVTVIAPDKEQSAVSLSITIRQPLHMETVHWEPHADIRTVNGTPADCVKLGLAVLSDLPPDLIVSGINRGTNAGRNILYSGTIGGAIEGVMHDIPSIAFSCSDYREEPDFAGAAKYIPDIVSHAFESPLPKGTLLNVNFPKKTLPIRGFKMTRHGMEYWAEDPDCRLHPTENRHYYWLGARLARFEEEEDCDVSWLRQGYVTAVPISVNQLTHLDHITTGKERFEQLFQGS